MSANDLIEAEAEEESGDEGRPNAPEEQEQEAATAVDGYEEDGFVVAPTADGGNPAGGDDDDDDDDDDDSEEDDGDELDEDDIDLIQENTGITVKRQADKKLKRLRKKRKTAPAERTEVPESEDHIRVAGRNAMEQLQEQLFDGADGDQEPSAGPADIEKINFDDDRNEDEMADFIEYEGDGDRPRMRDVGEEQPVQGGLNDEEKELLAAVFGPGKVAFTFESSDDEDDEEMQQDDEEDGGEGKVDRAAAAAKIFEPAAIKEHFLEERDETIRSTDLPERLQLWHKSGKPQVADGVTLEDEARWICNQHLRKLDRYMHNFEQNAESYTKSIQQVLRFLLEEHLEVPFIREYRKDYWAEKPKSRNVEEDDLHGVSGGMGGQELWKIMDWHDSWIKFVQRKQALRQLCVAEDCVKVMELSQVEQIHTSSELEDWFAYHARQQPADTASSTGRRRRPITRRLFAACKEHDIDQVAERIGLSAADFGDNLDRGYSRHNPNNEALAPEAVAELFIVKDHFLFSTAEQVLTSARKMLAQAIGTFPRVRKYFYDALQEEREKDPRRDMLFTTKATTLGFRVVREHHRYFRVRQLEDLPGDCFEAHDYLLLTKAQQEKLIDVTVSFSQEAIQSVRQRMTELYGVKVRAAGAMEVDEKVIEKEWNEVREQVLDDAINNWLLPSYMKECRRQLDVKARQFVITSCADELKSLASAGKYSPPGVLLDQEVETPDAFVVLACCHSDDVSEDSSLVVLDENLEVKDHMLVGHNRANDNYRRSIRAFIEKNLPHVIVIGTSTMRAVDLQEDMLSITKDLRKNLDQEHRNWPEGITDIDVCYQNDEIASLFRQSPRATAEFGKTHRYTPLTLQAIALGRHFMDPMTEVSNVAKNPDELLCLNLHEMQKDVSRTELLKELERTLVDVVNDVGVDLNMMMRTNFRVGPLEYVAGLGPRKALALRQGIALTGGLLSQRNDLIEKNLMGMKVFENCVGFLKIFGGRDQDLLDTTRIHPEAYETAHFLARIALSPDDDGNNDEDPNELVETVMLEENKYLLDDLPPREWADHFEKQGRGPMFNTVKMILSELKTPFEERRAFGRLTWTQVFELLTGEVTNDSDRSKRTLYEGALLDVTVLGIQDRGLMCMTESGVKGFLKIEEFSDNYDRDAVEQNMGAPEFSLENHVHRRQIIHVRVLDVVSDNAFPRLDERTDTYRRKTPLNLSCRGSVLRDKSQDPFTDYIPQEYWSSDPSSRKQWFRPEDDAEKMRDKRNGPQKKNVSSHQIDHPHFMNVTKVSVLEYLEKQPPGTFVIRPSSRGRDHLSITWKFAEDVPCIHIDVEQEGLSDNVTVGSAFKVGDEKFDDLDELIASYLEPRIDKANEMMGYKKYFSGGEDQVEQKLKTEADEGKSKVPYCVFASREKTGRFVLAYYYKKLRKEFIMIRSDGFWYRKQCFQKPGSVLDYFKQHFGKMAPK